MARKHMTRSDLLQKVKIEAQAYMASSRAIKLIALIILAEQYGFNNEELKLFLESFEDVLDNYNQSNSYQQLLKQWNDYFIQEIGEDILGFEDGKELH